MLEITAIFLLICICALQWIVIQMLRRKLRDSQREVASWKLAAASYDKEANSW